MIDKVFDSREELTGASDSSGLGNHATTGNRAYLRAYPRVGSQESTETRALAILAGVIHG